MRKYSLLLMTGLSVLTFSACTVAQDQSEPSAQRSGGQKGGQERKGPPPEAFTACNGLSVGSTCTVETPRGTLNGTCQSPRGEGELVCGPAGGKKPRR